jgi:hypothetical protein
MNDPTTKTQQRVARYQGRGPCRDLAGHPSAWTRLCCRGGAGHQYGVTAAAAGRMRMCRRLPGWSIACRKSSGPGLA